MAMYHMAAKAVSRGGGRSAVAASAYLSCSRIVNDYDGVEHDYTRKTGLIWENVFLPAYAPQEWQDRSVLWNAVEANEKTKDSRLAREFVVALPFELQEPQWKSLLSDYITENFVTEGMCADVAIHDPYPIGHNPHAHILLTVRPLDENGKWQYKTEKEYLCIRDGEEKGFTAAEFQTAQKEGWEKQYPYKVGKKKVYLAPSEAEKQEYERANKYPKSTKYGRQNPIAERWNSEEQLILWRKAWADIINLYLEQAGCPDRVDHRSHAERGLEEQPTVHEGVAARAMEAKGMIADRCELNRQIKADNALLRELKAQMKKLVQAVKNSVPALAEAMETLRANMIVFCYQLRHIGVCKHKLQEYLNTTRMTLTEYFELIKKIKSCSKQRKQLMTEKKNTLAFSILKHKELNSKIARMTEDLEELKSEKEILLSRFDCDDDAGIADVKKKIAAAEANLSTLDQQEERYSSELDAALAEYEDLQNQAADCDTKELQSKRMELRPAKTEAATNRIKAAYGEKFSFKIAFDSGQEIDKMLDKKKLADQTQQRNDEKQKQTTIINEER